MDLLPKGPTDKLMVDMTPEEKQGWTYNHNFTLSTDIKFINKLEKKNKDAVKEAEMKMMMPGASITRSRDE